MQKQVLELHTSSEYEGYYEGLFDQSIIDASFYSWYSSYVPYDPSNPDIYHYDFFAAVDFVLIVDGVSYSGFINLEAFYCYVGNEDLLFYGSYQSPSDVPCTFELCFDDYSEPSEFSSYTEGYVYFPSSYFEDPSAETQTVTISAYIGTVPSGENLAVGAVIDLDDPARIYNSDDTVTCIYDIPLDPYCFFYGVPKGTNTLVYIGGSTNIYFTQTEEGVISEREYDSLLIDAYPLGYNTEISNGNWIRISDLRSGFNFSVDVTLDANIQLENSTEEFAIAYLTCFYDEYGSMIDHQFNYVTIDAFSGYKAWQDTLTFTVPEGAAYFDIQLQMGLINVEDVVLLDCRMTSMEVAVDMSAVESNSQMMTGIIDRLDTLVDEALEANESLDEIIDLLQQIIAYLSSSGCDHSEIVELLERITGNQDQELTWLEKIWEAITSIPDQIGQTMQDLFVPSEEKVQEVIDKAEELVDEHLGGVVQAGEAVTQVVGAFTKQTTQETITFPSVTLTFSGVPWTFGGWEVDVIPDGFEFLFDALALVIDIIATIAFVNSMKTRWGKVMEG